MGIRFDFIRKLADEERLKRDLFATFDDVIASGDKDGRIRTVLGADLEAGRVYANKAISSEFKQEVKMFPSSRSKDLLDSSVIALAKSNPPLTEEDQMDMDEQEERFRDRVVNSFGW